MADALGTTVTIRGNSDDFTATIDKDIASLRQFGETMNTTSRTAVAAFRSESEGLRSFGVEAGVAKEKMLELDGVIAATNVRIAESGITAGATSQVFRGLFMEAGQSQVMGRGMLTTVSGIASMFGGPWVAGLAIAGFALERFFLRSEKGFDNMKAQLKDIDEQFKTLSLSGQSAAIAVTESHMAALKAAQAELADPKWTSIATDPQTAQLMTARHDALLKQVADLTTIVAHERTLLDTGSKELANESIKQQMLVATRDIVKDTKELREAEAAGMLTFADQLRDKLAHDTQLLADLRTSARQQIAEGSTLRAETDAMPTQMHTALRADAAAAGLADEKKKDEQLQRGAEQGLAAVARVMDALPGMLEAPIDVITKKLDDQINGPAQSTKTKDSLGIPDSVVASYEQGRKIGLAETKKAEEQEKHDGTVQLKPGQQFIVPDLTPWQKFLDIVKQLSPAFLLAKHKIDEMSAAQLLAADIMASSTKNVIETAVKAHKESIGALTAAALQPVVSWLEGQAIQYAAAGAAAAVTGNEVTAAGDFAAAALLTVAAHEVSSFAGGMSTHGGGSSGGGGSGGTTRAPLGTSGIGALGAQRSGQAAMSLEVILTQKAPTGKTLQRQRQALQRLNNRDVPFNMALD